jgi:ribosomal protein S18 acetylase RimI-like enzyme
VAEVIAEGEAFYRARARESFFQIGPTAPSGLDDALAARGYATEDAVWVQTVRLREEPGAALQRESAPRFDTRVSAAPDTAWIDVEIVRGRFADIAPTFLAALATLGSRAGFATAAIDGRAAAACLLVHDEDVVVLAAMRTLPEARRRGAARALARAGARWGLERGATTGLLQVEVSNHAALALYASEGYSTTYGYHYRVPSLR